MTSRLTFLAILLFCLMTGAAWADGAHGTAVVVFSDGERLEFRSADPRDPLKGIETLLFDPRDGTCEVQVDGRVVLNMVKTGEAVKLISHGNERTVTLQAAREELGVANAMSQAGLKKGHQGEFEPQGPSSGRREASPDCCIQEKAK